MSHTQLVVCEAPDDFALACRLIDRTIEAAPPEWARGEDLALVREYIGVNPTQAEPGERFVRWGNLVAVVEGLALTHAQRLAIATTRFGQSVPDHGDAVTFHRFVRVLTVSDRVPTPDAFILIRDADASPDRRDALLAFNSEQFAVMPVVVGSPDPESECWLLAGFPHEASLAEQAAIDEYQRAISLPPCRESHRLRASSTGDERHPKRVLSVLTADNRLRVEVCLEAPFAMLRTHGRENGLAPFLDALQHRLLPGLFGGAVSTAAG